MRSSLLTHSSIKYDYNSYKQELVIRTPTAIHKVFIEKVVHDIGSQLDAIGKSVDIARDIDSIGSTQLKFENGSQHSPNAAYMWNGSQYLHLVMEISYSQKRKDLSYLAEHWSGDWPRY